ncbi:hypothetical protein ACX8Z9_04690 [Arthrobacter halodurans]|uniref:DUF927 domain-containing protein n=1 Tax=Arthrobacter halodurans TaxID=516699 RepID=A0ABV4US02_9MICC
MNPATSTLSTIVLLPFGPAKRAAAVASGHRIMTFAMDRATADATKEEGGGMLPHRLSLVPHAAQLTDEESAAIARCFRVTTHLVIRPGTETPAERVDELAALLVYLGAPQIWVFSDTDPDVALTTVSGSPVVSGFTIPDFTSEATADAAADVPAPVWGEDAYGYIAPGSGAKKLAASAVAPVVAAARGYRTATPATLKAEAEALGTKLNAVRGRQLKTAVTDGDAMVMPWYSISTVAEGGDLVAESYQLRPAVAPVNAKGKTQKYMNPADLPTVLGVHPATPANWFVTAPVYMLCEGMLKADAAFSAYLAAKGVTVEVLSAEHGGNPAAARAALAEELAAIPAEERVLILSSVSCGTWHAHPEWNSIRLAGREAWVALDGDISTNRAVWNEAEKLRVFLSGPKKAAAVRILTLPTEGKDDKTGIDDYLSAGGSWSGIVGLLGAMPAAPAGVSVARIRVADVDLDQGLTYRRAKLPDGSHEYQALAEAAVAIEEVSVVSSPYPGVPRTKHISGTASWRVYRTDGSFFVRSATFRGQGTARLLSGQGTVGEVMEKLAPAGGAGAAVEIGADRQVKAAWAYSLQNAIEINGVATSGLTENDEGVLGWLTEHGLLTPTGLETEFRSRLPEAVSPINVPWVDPAEEPERITDAWEQWNGTRRLYSDAVSGLLEVTAGMVFSCAVGVQPKGTVGLFCPPNLGKTAALRHLGGWYGTGWLRVPAIKLSGTVASIRHASEAPNNVVITVDDARDSGKANAIEEIRMTVDGLLRMGYEPENVHQKMIRGEDGAMFPKPKLPNACRTTIISGENLEQLGLQVSSAQRLLSFQVPDNGELLRGEGKIAPALEALEETGAMSILFGAFLVQRLRSAAAAEVPRRALAREQQVLVAQEAIELRKVAAADRGVPVAEYKLGHRGTERRSNELLEPALGGFRALLEMVAAAYTAQGRKAEAEMVMGGMAVARTAVFGAWKRHRRMFGEDADATQDRVVGVLIDALAIGRAVWAGQSNDYDRAPSTVIIGRNDVGPANDIVLLAGPVHALLQSMGMKIDERTLKAEIKPIISDPRKGIRVGASVTKGWLIKRADWDAATGIDMVAFEAEQRAADPAREIADRAKAAVCARKVDGAAAAAGTAGSRRVPAADAGTDDFEF